MHRAARSACAALLAGLALVLAAPVAGQAALPAGFIGLCSDQSYWIEDEFTAGWNIALQKRSGIENVRVAIRWSDLELSPGVWSYARSDRVVRRLVSRGLDVLPVLQTPPPFRSAAPAANPNPGMYPPRNNADFAQFAVKMVARYGPQGSFWRDNPDVVARPITAWQVWNEPNIGPWWASGPNAEEYTRLLRTTSNAIRATDPDAEVVSAGIPDSRMGIPQQQYLREMYAAGARGTFDTLGLHGYASTVGELIEQIRTTRALMSEFRDRSPIWLTEFGWATGGVVSAFTTTEAGQAARIGQAVRTLAAERVALGLRGFHIFTWQDIPGGTIWPYWAGLIRADGSPKPGGWAFLDAVADIRAAAGDPLPPAPQLTPAPPATPAPQDPPPGGAVDSPAGPATGVSEAAPQPAVDRPAGATRPPAPAPVPPGVDAFRVLRSTGNGVAPAGLAYFPAAGTTLVPNRGTLSFAVLNACRGGCRMRADYTLSVRGGDGRWRRMAVRPQLLRLSGRRAGVLKLALTPARLARLQRARKAKLKAVVSSAAGEHGAVSAPTSLVVVLAPAR